LIEIFEILITIFLRPNSSYCNFAIIFLNCAFFVLFSRSILLALILKSSLGLFASSSSFSSSFTSSFLLSLSFFTSFTTFSITCFLSNLGVMGFLGRREMREGWRRNAKKKGIKLNLEKRGGLVFLRWWETTFLVP